ncbi:MAG TPA: hypothetical protein DDW50_12655 [Firmicutes bacterium]|nr:hypothetical protein [Bacillota bacterium]
MLILVNQGSEKNLLSPKYFLYLAMGVAGKNKIDISSNPRVDAYYLSQHGCQEMYIFQPPQPIWAAEILLRRLLSEYNESQWYQPKKLAGLASRILNEVMPQRELKIQHEMVRELKLNEFDPPEIGSLIWGRALLGTEIPGLLHSNGMELPWDPEDWLQYWYLQSELKREASVSVDNLGLPFCRRCGESKAIIEDNCIFCGNTHCLTCTNCQTMGVAKSCIPLYSQSYPNHQSMKFQIEPRLKFELTQPQQRASEAVIRFLESRQPEFLVWAVCGAGKTEVSFGGLSRVISQGQRVLYAIPRKDVVIELTPRLQEAFPEVPISTMYGGSGERFLDGPLTIATTHQCLRFYQSFDMVILDEADAYPYQGCAMLHYAVGRALKPGGHLLIMTATPSQTMLRQIRNRTLDYILIPARHHRKPLIVPQWLKCDLPLAADFKRKGEPPLIIREFIMSLKKNQRSGFIFMPTILQIESIGSSLVSWAATCGIMGEIIHSRSANRAEAKERMLQGQIQFVVTSTIFERGITIPNLDVMVLHADEEKIFNNQTLIQIAGRVGRLGEAGRVLWLSKTQSRSMKTAIQIIEDMNREGYELDYLDH